MTLELRECIACGGVYAPDQNGYLYAHVCPPVVNPAFQPDPRAAKYDPRETVERPGHRDENPVAHTRRANDAANDIAESVTIRAAGAGARVLVAQPDGSLEPDDDVEAING
jgi:hypothetical protein